jgi:hypothetical protein
VGPAFADKTCKKRSTPTIRKVVVKPNHLFLAGASVALASRNVDVEVCFFIVFSFHWFEFKEPRP